MTPPAGDDLRVVVLSYGVSVTCMPLVRSLVERDGVRGEDILVVHNPAGAPDSHTEAPSRMGVRLTELPKNVGYAGGMNAGLRDPRTREAASVLLITQDVALEQGCLDALYQASVAYPDCGVLGPVLEKEARVWSGGKVLERTGAFRHVKARPDGELRLTEFIDGSVMLVRTAAITEESPFDERLFMYFEETDLCWRLRQRGWHIGVVRNARANSEPGGARRPATHSYLMTRNGLEVSWARGGGRRCAAYCLHTVRSLVRAWPKPGTARFWDYERRQVGYRQCRGTLAGYRDFALRRFGPPPPNLRDGDLKV